MLSGTENSAEGKTGTPEGDECIVLEAEHFSEKNSASIRPAGEYDATAEPYDCSKLKLNMLSGTSFSDGGQSVTYSFNVDKSGYYYIGFKYRQNSKTDFPVFRDILIDGTLTPMILRMLSLIIQKALRRLRLRIKTETL